MYFGFFCGVVTNWFGVSNVCVSQVFSCACPSILRFVSLQTLYSHWGIQSQSSTTILTAYINSHLFAEILSFLCFLKHSLFDFPYFESSNVVYWDEMAFRFFFLSSFAIVACSSCAEHIFDLDGQLCLKVHVRIMLWHMFWNFLTLTVHRKNPWVHGNTSLSRAEIQIKTKESSFFAFSTATLLSI